MYECKSCRHRTSLKSGTVMHKSKLPYRYWLLVFHLMTSTPKGFSSKEIQRQLGQKRYQPIWHLVHKIRTYTGTRDDTYSLCGTPELDEGFFTVEVLSDKKDEPGKRDRGSQRKAKVPVMAESDPDSEQLRKGKGRKAGHLKMQVISDLTSETITGQVKKFVSSESHPDTDDSASYTGLEDVVAEHFQPKICRRSFV